MIWLLLPASLFWDLWKLKPLGLTGLQAVGGLLLVYGVFLPRRFGKRKYKIG